MTQVSRKGFVDKNGQKVVIVPPKEEYTGEAIFSDSDAIDTILSEGVHHISYKKDGKRHPTQHILVVTRDYGKTGPIAPTREIVFQLLIDDFRGMMKRYRKFTDTELLEPDGDWTEWVSMIPTVDSTITEDGGNPVTGAAIYAALAGKAASNHTHAISNVTGLQDALIAVDASANGLIRSLYFVIPSGSTYSPSRLADWVDSTHKVFDYALELPAYGSVTVKAIGGCYAYGGPGYEDTDQGEVNVTKVIANSPSPVAGQRVSWNIYDELIAAGNTAYGSVDYVKDIVICVEISEALQSDKMFVLSVLPYIDSEL